MRNFRKQRRRSHPPIYLYKLCVYTRGYVRRLRESPSLLFLRNFARDAIRALLSPQALYTTPIDNTH